MDNCSRNRHAGWHRTHTSRSIFSNNAQQHTPPHIKDTRFVFPQKLLNSPHEYFYDFIFLYI